MLIFHEEFIVQYSIRSPTHPFIEIIRNTDEKSDGNSHHRLVIDQIEFIFDHKSINFVIATNLVKPLVIYVFLESSLFKHQLANLLVKIFSKEYNDLLVDLIKLYFSSLKVKIM
jgi:hypothetical protein